MDKLNLDLNDLEVDSFQANPEQEEKRGTVQGNDKSEKPCFHTWRYTCDASCDCNIETWRYTCDREKTKEVPCDITGWVGGC